MKARCTLAILEDDDLVRATLAEAASSVGPLLWQSSSIADARRQLAQAPPDVLLVDLRLPDGSGFDVLELGAAHPSMRCLVISALGDEGTVLRAIELGAAGYLLKDLAAPQITAAIRDVIDGGAPITPRLATYVLRRLRGPARDAPPAEALTSRENDILEGLARGMSYAELAAQRHVSYHTINTHVKTIYRKLAVRSKNQAIYKALRGGLVRLDGHT